MKRILAVLFVGGVLVIGGLGYLLFADRSSFESGLVSYEGLPKWASDISVFQNPNISGTFVADFRISETDWVAFCAERRWGLSEVTGDEHIFRAAAFRDGRPNDRKAIIDGLFFSKLYPNGAGVIVAYDRAESRAYIFQSRR